MSDTVRSDLPDEQALAAEVAAAFGGVDLGNGVTWLEAESIDNYESPAERAAARRTDVSAGGWLTVSDQLFDRFPSAVTFLDAHGFRYYLPAFIVADIRRGGRWESAVDDGVLARLEDPSRVADLLPLLHDRQRRAVSAWLRLVRHRHPSRSSPAVQLWDPVAPYDPGEERRTTAG